MVEKPARSPLAGIAKAAREAVERGDDVESNVSAAVNARHEGIARLKDTTFIRAERVDPALCRPSAQNARDYAKLTADNCADLIESIRTEGAQHTPALVRQTADPAVPYEIVTGSRRHFAVSWLKANNYPDIKYYIEVRDLTDEASFRLSDEENRARKDVTDLERGRAYAAALAAFYNGSVTQMAERLAIKELTLRRYLAVAALPQEVIEAVGGQEVLTVSHARQIGPELSKGRPQRERLISEAVLIGKEQTSLRSAGKPLIAPPVVLARLAKATKEQKPGPGRKATVINDADGNELIAYSAPTRVHGLSLKVVPKFGGSRQALIDAVMQVIDTCYPEKPEGKGGG